MNQCTDLVLYFMNTPFSSLSYEEQCVAKEKRPKPHLNIVQTDGHQTRKFNSQWYEQYEWLTASVTTSKMYCYACLLFGGEKDWCESGIAFMKNLHRRAQKHQISKRHIVNWEQYHLLGKHRVEHALSEAARLSTLRHNEMVSRNRRLVRRLVQVICFLGKQELAFSGNEGCQPENKGNYLEMLDFLAQEEQLMRENLESTADFKGTSPDIQDELTECVALVLNETIQKELDSCEFVSVEADETLDVSCRSQISIVLRYCVEDSVQERFLGFFDVPKGGTGQSVATVILDVLKCRKVEKKLVCQTYDGALAAVASQGCVPAVVRRQCPHALFLHCHAHALNLLLLHAAKTIKKVRLFVYDLTAFRAYFGRCSKRCQLLREAGFQLPEASTARWNYHSRAIPTILSHFHAIKGALCHVVSNDTDWDGESFNGALALVDRLQDPYFLFMLCLYQRIFTFSEPLGDVLEVNCMSNVTVCNHEIKLAITNVKGLRTTETVEECTKAAMALNGQVMPEPFSAIETLAFEIIDSAVTEMKRRFEDFADFHFVELLDERQFPAYRSSFPSSKLGRLTQQYPQFDMEQLKNELANVYADVTKHLPPRVLLKAFLDNGLESIYKETVRLIRLILTFPVSPATIPTGASTLERVKTFLRNSMRDSRLSHLSTLAIEKGLLNHISRDNSLKEHVIDVFAERKLRRTDLIYKR